ncbi:hypothetical protein G7K_2516-t1 [Saitoella complicata NRRL Y-17804]|uniref:Arrestin C-terminal-like domain-containing protein n=1 Tax=Saitoella complicata (strain BCRC 22490 / CBS 7301 / JCM 7358 / NBRC 10748 / NRRL Y-17804) TaxID=698492 RepID=A0A0E9NEU0_SAICN|nr:hypothetical protein G7K_2516-t1 [Saitoella complicata NRRL Y-17804]
MSQDASSVPFVPVRSTSRRQNGSHPGGHAQCSSDPGFQSQPPPHIPWSAIVNNGTAAQDDTTQAQHGKHFSQSTVGADLAAYLNGQDSEFQDGTYVRAKPPVEVLNGDTKHDRRVKLSTVLNAVLHVGGGKIRGRLVLTIKDSKRHPVKIGDLALDLVGVEVLPHASKQGIFFSITSHLITPKSNPAPGNLVHAYTGCDDQGYWLAKTGTQAQAFELPLPLNVGPGTFYSEDAEIRYLLAATLRYKSNDKISVVRTVTTLLLYPCLDPEKALLPLEYPLRSTEEGRQLLGGQGVVTLVAQSHRTTWIAGQLAFVELHISNQSARTIRHVQMKLVRHVISFKRPGAFSFNRPAGQLRVPDRIKTRVVSSTAIHAGHETDLPGYRWRGVAPKSIDSSTLRIQVPGDQLTVREGRYFEVKYFINIAVSATLSHNVHVQIPVTIVNILSLDTNPDDLFDVAAAIRRERRRLSQPNMNESAQNSRVLPRMSAQTFLAAQAPAPAELTGSPAIRSHTPIEPAAEEAKEVEDGGPEDDSILRLVFAAKTKPLDIKRLDDGDGTNRFLIPGRNGVVAVSDPREPPAQTYERREVSAGGHTRRASNIAPFAKLRPSLDGEDESPRTRRIRRTASLDVSKMQGATQTLDRIFEGGSDDNDVETCEEVGRSTKGVGLPWVWAFI